MDGVLSPNHEHEGESCGVSQGSRPGCLTNGHMQDISVPFWSTPPFSYPDAGTSSGRESMTSMQVVTLRCYAQGWPPPGAFSRPVGRICHPGDHGAFSWPVWVISATMVTHAPTSPQSLPTRLRTPWMRCAPLRPAEATGPRAAPDRHWWQGIYIWTCRGICGHEGYHMRWRTYTTFR